jgi:hypothetical protein
MIVALAYLLLSSTAFAQAQPAVLTGVVSDQNGVSLMDSRVVLYLDDGRVLESEIGSEGTFSFEIEGSFEIEIAHPGYRSVRTTPATLSSGATYEIQVVLLEGDSADFETVELLLDDPVTLTGALGPTLSEDLPRSDYVAASTFPESRKVRPSNGSLPRETSSRARRVPQR